MHTWIINALTAFVCYHNDIKFIAILFIYRVILPEIDCKYLNLHVNVPLRHQLCYIWGVTYTVQCYDEWVFEWSVFLVCFWLSILTLLSQRKKNVKAYTSPSRPHVGVEWKINVYEHPHCYHYAECLSRKNIVAYTNYVLYKYKSITTASKMLYKNIYL